MESISNIYTGYDSSLKLSGGGKRLHSTGDIRDLGTSIIYWTSTVNGTGANYLILNNYSKINKSVRSTGYSCRCIKNDLHN